MRDVIIMAAPNGARRTKEDHPNLPMTIEEITAEAIRCRDAGATVIHAHVRNHEGKHVLDSGLYTELLAEISEIDPNLLIQITTEAVDRYTPIQQIETVFSVKPDMVSVALKELVPSQSDEQMAAKFYGWASEAGIHVQHILYDPQDVRYYNFLRHEGIIPEQPSGALFVLGKYSDNQQAIPKELPQLFKEAGEMLSPWFCCAFGDKEAECMRDTIMQGGHCRVGFENNMLLSDGAIAQGTFELVSQTVSQVQALGMVVADENKTREMLGV